MRYRVGQGVDVHAYCVGDHVILGGVRIPYHQGIAAHSDGDLVYHALCDALLGAAALGDIGQHFSDKDARWRGAAGAVLIAEVMRLVQAQGWQPVNADVTVLAQAPRLAEHVLAMRSHIAQHMGLPIQAVSVKATTTEKLGFIGRGEGIAAEAVVLIASAVMDSPL